MFKSSLYRALKTILRSLIVALFVVTPVIAADLEETVAQFARCHSGLLTLSEVHPNVESRSDYAGFASYLESLTPLYAELGGLSPEIEANAAAQARRDIIDITDTRDNERLHAFIYPCSVIIENIERYEYETVFVSNALACLAISIVEVPSKFLEVFPDSPFAPMIREQLESLLQQQ